jgi:hypothetical protein
MALSYDLGIVSLKPPLLKRKRNVGLGAIIATGIILQLIGHTSMAVSSRLPDNFAAWTMHRLTFEFGKIFARGAVWHTYHSLFQRINATHTDKCSLFSVCIIWCLIFLGGRVGIIGYEIEEYTVLSESPDIMTTNWMIALSALNFLVNLCFCVHLIWIIVQTRKESETRAAVPWHQCSWMLGYYTMLQIVPILILVQDIYGLVRALTTSRTEMVEMACEMSMTKMIFLVVGPGAYEVSVALSETGPKRLEDYKKQIYDFIEQRIERKHVPDKGEEMLVGG